MWRGGGLPVRAAGCVAWRVEDDMCACGEERESPEHLFLRCKAMADLRGRHVGPLTQDSLLGYDERAGESGRVLRYLGEVWRRRLALEGTRESGCP